MYRSDKQFMKNPATAAMRIYIGNLAEFVVPDNLEERFKQHGNILGMHAQRGFAFIQYETEAQARLAIEREHGSLFHHRKINVKHANVDKRPVGPGGPTDQRNQRPPFDQSMNRMNEPPSALGGVSGVSVDFGASGDSSIGRRGPNPDQLGSGTSMGKSMNEGPGPMGTGSNQQLTRDQGIMGSGPIHQQQQQNFMGVGPNQHQGRDPGNVGVGTYQHQGNMGGGPNQHQAIMGGGPNLHQGNMGGGPNQQIRDQGWIDRNQGGIVGGPNQNNMGGGPNQQQIREQGIMGVGTNPHQTNIGVGPNQQQGRDQGNMGGMGGGPNQQGRDQSNMGGMGGGPIQQGRDQSNMGGMGGGPNQQTRDQGWLDRDQGGMGGGPNQNQGRGEMGGMGGGPMRSGGPGTDRGNQRDRDDSGYDNRNKFGGSGGGGRNRGRGGVGRGIPYNNQDRGIGRENYSRDRNDSFDNFGPRSGPNKPDNIQARVPLNSLLGPIGQRGPLGSSGPRGASISDSIVGGSNIGSIDASNSSAPGLGSAINAKLPIASERPDRNDCEIIVVSKLLTIYAEYIEQRLKALGLVVDLLYPNEDVPLGRVLANISSRGCLFAILVMPLNEENRSLTLNILHGIPQEHRNMPIEDSFILLTRNFDAYMRGEISSTTDDEDTKKLSDRHPDQIQTIFNLLAENRQLSSGQYDRIIKYLQERKELQIQFEVTEGIESDLVEPEVKNKRAELQSRIMNILNKTDDIITSTPIKTDLLTPTATIMPSSGTPLLNDPTVQKALDSILLGDMFKGLTGAL